MGRIYDSDVARAAFLRNEELVRSLAEITCLQLGRWSERYLAHDDTGLAGNRKPGRKPGLVVVFGEDYNLRQPRRIVR